MNLTYFIAAPPPSTPIGNLFGNVADGYLLTNDGEHISQPIPSSATKPFKCAHNLYLSLEKIQGFQVSYDAKGKASFTFDKSNPVTQWGDLVGPPDEAQQKQMKEDLRDVL